MSFYRRVRGRRGTEHVPSSKICAEGSAILCFPSDGAFFRGLLTTQELDDSPYALFGRETPTPGQYQVTIADLDAGTQHHLSNVNLRGKLRKDNDCEKSTSVPTENSSAAIPISTAPPREYSTPNSLEDTNMFLNHFPHGNEDLKFELSDSEASSRASSLSPVGVETSPKSPQFSLETEDDENSLQFTANSVYRGQKADMMIQQFMAGSKLVGSQCVVLVGPLKFSLFDTPFTTASMAWSL